MNQVETIIRNATRVDSEPLNIVCAPTHERYESGMAKTGNEFWSYNHPTFKEYDECRKTRESNS